MMDVASPHTLHPGWLTFKTARLALNAMAYNPSHVGAPSFLDSPFIGCQRYFVGCVWPIEDLLLAKSTGRTNVYLCSTCTMFF